ncbi:MAG: HD domain-containing protein [Candidatus Thiodiazotropha sp. (ex Lucinoma borealis)]|nr:HD domain-containing protein [Candidatus Thiodiazotropha sp. (ex Lucinoma borealis)]
MTYRKQIINKTVEFVKKHQANNEGSHDWWHTYRVWQLSKRLSKDEKVDSLVVELASLLHDIADYKFHDGDEKLGPKMTQEFLFSLNVDENTIDHVISILKNISFLGGQQRKFDSRELDIVQDSDRLDALGAIGIARTFSYGGYKGRAIYDPNIKPNMNMTKEEYILSDQPTINHFYEKLLLLKNNMRTRQGRKLAKKRHKFMEVYLNEFYKEIGNDE